MENPDYYEILGVSKDADAPQIKAAFRNRALKFHPDRNMENPEAVRKMKQLNEAYAVLSNPEKRQAYDTLRQQYGRRQAYSHFRQSYSDHDIFSGTDIHKVFDELARSFGFRNFEDISREFQGSKAQWFKKETPNGALKGLFFFGAFSLNSLPANILLPGKIGKIVKIAKIANLLLKNMSGESPAFQGDDIHDAIQIDPQLARTGGPYAYFHQNRSKKLVVKIPPNIRHGQQIRLAGMGSKGIEKSGDLYLRVETKSSIMNKIKQYLPF